MPAPRTRTEPTAINLAVALRLVREQRTEILRNWERWQLSGTVTEYDRRAHQTAMDRCDAEIASLERPVRS